MNQSEMMPTGNSMNHGSAHCVVRFMWIVLSVMTGASGGDAIGGDAERIESLDQLGVLNVLDPFAPESNITSTIGKRRILLRPGQLGLGYSPDEAIALFSQRPLRGFIVAASDTYLISGPSLNSIRVARKVLSPRRPGSVGNGYAGIKGFYVEPRTKRLIAVYHAEDNEDLPKVKVNDVTGAYWRACQAISTNGWLSFKKHGPIISSRVPKRALGTTQNADNPVQPIQGAGEPAVCLDKTGQFLHCYYTEAGQQARRGFQICTQLGYQHEAQPSRLGLEARRFR